MVSIRFPKEHEAFLSDSKTKRRIKKLEDRIEQLYQTRDLLQSLGGIVQIVEPPAKPAIRFAPPPEALLAMEEILSLLPPRDQLDIDRDAIWEMKARAGSQYVLGFLSPTLLLSMETLFSGIVVRYIQMFNKSRRRGPLGCESVFAGDEAALAFHLKVGEIRDKHYAHAEAAAGQHHLSYFVCENLELNVDRGGLHETVDFHLKLCHDLHRNLRKVQKYLEKDLDVLGESLLNGLSDGQRLALRQHWGEAAQRGLTTARVYAVSDRRKL